MNGLPNYRRLPQTYRRPILCGGKATYKTANYCRLIIPQTNSNVWEPGRWQTTADHLHLICKIAHWNPFK